MAEKVIGRNVPDGAVPDKDVANLLTNICQILDVVKLEWGAEKSWSPWDQEQRDRATEYLRKHYEALESRPVQQPAQLIAAQQAEDEGLWCIPKTAMEGHLQKELRRLTEAVEGKTSAECLRELLLKPPVQQPATEPDEQRKEAIVAYRLWKERFDLGHTEFDCFFRGWLAARHVPVGTEDSGLMVTCEKCGRHLVAASPLAHSPEAKEGR